LEVSRTKPASGARADESPAPLDAASPWPEVVGLARLNDELAQIARRAATAALVSCEPVADVAAELEAAAARLGVAVDELEPAALDRALADTRLAEVPPRTALRAQVDLVGATAGVVEASLWVAGQPGVVTCLASSSGVNPSRRVKVLARGTIDDDDVALTGVRSPILGVPVRRFGLAYGTLAVRLREMGDREAVEPLARLAATRIAPMLERHRMLEEGEARGQTLVEAVERRLVRTGYDLHDGPLQDVVVLAAELGLVAGDVTALVPEECRPAVAEALASLGERVCAVERGLREVAQSLGGTVVARRSLAELLEREAKELEQRSGIQVLSDVRADFGGLSDSQRITIYRAVQEALSNVAHHSGASKAAVRVRPRAGGIAVTIADDGRGFESESGMAAAAERGRLGLVGIAERVRLLGGVLTVASAPGAGTTVGVVLPRWVPANGPADARGAELDYSS
jgi:signal transduction histidine kinase